VVDVAVAELVVLVDDDTVVLVMDEVVEPVELEIVTVVVVTVVVVTVAVDPVSVDLVSVVPVSVVPVVWVVLDTVEVVVVLVQELHRTGQSSFVDFPTIGWSHLPTRSRHSGESCLPPQLGGVVVVLVAVDFVAVVAEV
jgi:hypothetical protein